jgi:hypothetical protein
MSGVAATGLGNKVADLIGESTNLKLNIQLF